MEWLSYGVAFLWYVSVIGVIGAAGAVRVFSPKQAPDVITSDWARASLRLARVLMPLVVLCLVARLWLQTAEAFGPDQPFLPFAKIIINETPWGDGWLWQVAVTLIAWMVIGASSVSMWPLLMAAALGPGLMVGLTGHAMGNQEARSLLLTTHGLHVAAAGMWLGGLSVLMTVTRRARHVNDESARMALAQAVGRFSPQAIFSVSVLAISGLIAAWQHTGGFEGLWSPYGVALGGKVAAFGGAALCGLYNWRVVRPALAANPDAVGRLRRTAGLELALGLTALVLTSVLTSLPMPDHD